MRKKIKLIIISITIIVLLCLFSYLIYFLLKKFNITSISTLRKFIGQFGQWAWLVFLLAQIILSVPIFVVPFEDELWVTLSIILFGVKTGFILSVIGMIFVSSILYLCGNKFGVKLANKFIGEKEVKRVQDKTNNRNKLSLPFLYLIPLFPHDVLCVTSGLGKINFIYFFFVTLFGRSLEIIAICFMGGELIPWSSLSGFDWLVLVNLALIDIYLLSRLQKLMEKHFDKKLTKSKSEQENTKRDLKVIENSDCKNIIESDEN